MDTQFVNFRRILISVFVATGVIASVFANQAFAQNGGAPTITIQPVKQTVDYGTDAAFSVVVTGAPLTYQWQRYGVNLFDYGKVSGSSTATLYLAGVSEDDDGKYQVVIGNGAGSVTSDIARLSVRSVTVFTDTFESGLGNWNPLINSVGLTLDSSQNHTTGGTNSAFLTSSAQAMYHRLEKMRGRVRLTAWFYDDGGNMPVYAELRGYSGPDGYGSYVPPHGLVQLFAIGRHAPPDNYGAGPGETLDPTLYQCRILAGTNTGWFNLNMEGTPHRSVGWHCLQIERERGERNVEFFVDTNKARVLHGAAPAGLDSVMIGSFGLGDNHEIPVVAGNAWFDDVTVVSYPGKFDYEDYDSTGRNLFPDWMKLREIGTNSNVLNVTPSTVCELVGSATNGGLGDWMFEGSGIYAGSLRGYLEYTVTAPAANAYRVEIEGRERNFLSPAVPLPLNIYIDNEFLGHFNMPYGATTNGLVHCFTPFIQAGPHNVRVEWDNWGTPQSLYVQAVRLQTLSGSVVYGHRKEAWVANRLVAQSGMDYAPESSFVSPVCVEGRGQYLSMMSLLAGTNYPLSSIPIGHGAGNRWYANVPLSPTNDTRVEVSFQNGAFTETNDMVWKVTNLLEPTNTTIRKGDSLLFTVLPNGTSNGPVTINIEGSEAYQTDASAPIPYQFDQAGTFTVTGTFNSTGASGSITVNVVDASLVNHLAFYMNKAGGVYWNTTNPPPGMVVDFTGGAYWECTNLTSGVVLDGDPRLKLTEISHAERSQRNPRLSPLGANGHEFHLFDDSTEPYYILARLGTNGPILGRTAVQGFRWLMPPDTMLKIVQIYPDGTRLIEGTYVMSPVLPSVSVDFEVHTSGLTFDDGTLTKTVLPSSFDSLGVCHLNFIWAPGLEGSVCNTTKLYDDGVLIGWK